MGEDEVLLNDSLRYGERLENEGGTSQIHTWEGMVHVFPSNIALLSAAKEALDDIGDFLRQQLLNNAVTRTANVTAIQDGMVAGSGQKDGKAAGLPAK